MTPINVVLRLAVIIFFSEGLIMLGRPHFSPFFSTPVEAAIDAAVLTLLTSPLAYFWVIRPFIQARNYAEKALLDAHDHLEIQVENRTRDLTQEISLRQEAESRLEKEVNAARWMQEALLPSLPIIKKIEEEFELDISSHFETSSELGGDLWGLHQRRMSDRLLGIYIVDFTGHGVSAAVNTFRLDAMMNEFRPSDGDPAAYLAALNDQLANLLPTIQFATMFYGILDVDNHVLTYSAAASPPPIFLREGSKELTFLDACGVPLGVKKGVEYENHQVEFPPGSLLFLYCDALLETPDKDGNVLEEEGVKELLSESLVHNNGRAPLDHLIDSFHGKVGQCLPDDLTAILIRRR